MTGFACIEIFAAEDIDKTTIAHFVGMQRDAGRFNKLHGGPTFQAGLGVTESIDVGGPVGLHADGFDHAKNESFDHLRIGQHGSITVKKVN